MIAAAVSTAVVLVSVVVWSGWHVRRLVRERARLQARVRFLQCVVENLPVEVMAVDAAEGGTLVNRMARVTTGLGPEPTVAPADLERSIRAATMRPADQPADRLDVEDWPLRRALAGLDTDIEVLVEPGADAAVNPIGKPARLSLHGRPLTDDDGHVVGAVAVGYELTALHEAHLAISRHQRATGMIAQAVRAVLTRRDGPSAIIQAGQAITGAVMAALYQPDRHGDLVCTAATPQALVGMRIPVTSTGATATTHRDGRPIWADDVTTDSRVDAILTQDVERDIQAVIRSGVWHPIMHYGRCLGVLVICCPAGVDPPSRSKELLDLLACETAMALAHQDLLRELERLSTQDPLTGVANRRAWVANLREEMSRAGRAHLPLSVLMIDLDHFKVYNDTHGHAAGDQLLCEATQLWQRRLRPADLLCRWGGEEFAVVLTNCTLQAARQIADDLRTLTAGTTCSIGLAEWDHRETYTDLLERVDTRLYAAKAAGRNRVHT